MYDTIQFERYERKQADRTSIVLSELRNVGRAVLNAETGQRGYFITLDEQYLQPYRSGRDQLGPAIERLRGAVGPNPTARQAELMDRIELLAETTVADLTETVELIERGALLDARRQVLSDDGLESMQRLRRNIREMEQLENAMLDEASTRSTSAERRVVPLLAALFALLLAAIFLGYWLISRTAQAEAEAAHAAELAKAHDRADLLAKELNHRVKNLFAVILAIVQLSGRDTPEAKPLLDRIAQRIRALMTAHDVTQGSGAHPVATLGTLVETTLSPYRSEDLAVTLEGPEIKLSAEQVTPLGLVLHELATNTVKYGAWANDGELAVSWQETGEDVELSWCETGFSVPEKPEREGFGSMLMVSASRQLSGSIDRNFTDRGVEVQITFKHGG